MRINQISSVYSNNFYGIQNKRNTNADTISYLGTDGNVLVMNPAARKYFELVKNISNKKVGSKFIIKPKSPKYRDLNILITPDSVIKSNDIYIGIEKPNKTSFKGRLYGSIRQDGDNIDYTMQNEYIRFWMDGMHSLVNEKYRDKQYAPLLKNDYNFFIPSDGDGTRYKDVTTLQNGRTKPASYIPATLNGKNMSLVQNVISNYTKTGKLDKMFDLIRVKPAQGSAYAFLEGLKSGQISTQRPIVFSWGDNFTDADISKIMYEHEKTGSAFTITTIPVEKSQTKSLSVVKIDSFENKTITDFVEKPQDDKFIESCVVKELGKDKCLSAVGPYILSPAVLSWIKEKYINNPESFRSPDKGFDFSSMVVAPALFAMKTGEIPNAQMKLAIIPKDETWSDLGSQKDFSKAMKNITLGAYSHLPSEILESVKQNVDADSNITFNKKSRKIFDLMLSDLNIQAQNVIAYCEE